MTVLVTINETTNTNLPLVILGPPALVEPAVPLEPAVGVLGDMVSMVEEMVLMMKQ